MSEKIRLPLYVDIEFHEPEEKEGTGAITFSLYGGYMHHLTFNKEYAKEHNITLWVFCNKVYFSKEKMLEAVARSLMVRMEFST